MYFAYWTSKWSSISLHSIENGRRVKDYWNQRVLLFGFVHLDSAVRNHGTKFEIPGYFLRKLYPRSSGSPLEQRFANVLSENDREKLQIKKCVVMHVDKDFCLDTLHPSTLRQDADTWEIRCGRRHEFIGEMEFEWRFRALTREVDTDVCGQDHRRRSVTERSRVDSLRHNCEADITERRLGHERYESYGRSCTTGSTRQQERCVLIS